jgi:hypothetical protein|tara:strand:- start:1520 stop:1774 length:255 start_codon:yes stop_codon:yes gene_type:complete
MEDRTLLVVLVVSIVLLLGFVFYVNLYNPFSSLENPFVGEGLGTLCFSPEKCQEFCQDNRGRCNDYCESNPTNLLCDELFGGVN